MNANAPYQNVTFQFEAAQFPPPFCYRYTLVITNNGKTFDVEFAIDYYDRQEINEDEILAEGFSMEDDFYWKGNLPDQWYEAIHEQIKKLTPAKSINSGNLQIYTNKENGATQTLVHNDQEMLEYFLQELIQAIYEFTGKQDPLYIKALDKKSNHTTKYSLTISFLYRQATLEIDKNKHTINWANTKIIMEQIFGLDYDPFNASKKIPKQKGFFIDPGEGLWYQANETANVYDGDEKAENVLKRIFSEY